MLMLTESRGFLRATHTASRLLATTYGLSPIAFDVLTALHRHAPTKLCAAELAHAFEKSDEYIGRVLRALESDGFVVRSRDRGDARAKQVTLTRKAIQRLRRIARAVFGIDVAMLKRGHPTADTIN